MGYPPLISGGGVLVDTFLLCCAVRVKGCQWQQWQWAMSERKERNNNKVLSGRMNNYNTAKRENSSSPLFPFFFFHSYYCNWVQCVLCVCRGSSLMFKEFLKAQLSSSTTSSRRRNFWPVFFCVCVLVSSY